MPETEREFQIFAKPVGATCNLKCTYCYYLKNRHLYSRGKKVLMPATILERFIVQTIDASSGDMIGFSWHGGEPMLAGIQFYEKVIALQKKYKRHGKTILNGIQTNGTLINPEWCRFFRDNHFVVGISIDGPGNIHNKNRTFPDGRPSFNRVLTGYRLLQKYNIPVEILCVVNAENAGSPLEVYDFFRKLNARYLTFLPLVIRKSGSETEVRQDSVTAFEFGKFMSAIFDEWAGKDIGIIKIQIFEEMIRPAFGQEHTLCIFKENCGGVPVLEHNGDLYSCDHYVTPEHLIGNILHGTIAEFLDSQKQKSFGMLKSLKLPGECKNCEVKQMCNGECPRNRFGATAGKEEGLNYLCEGYKYLFNHCRPFIDAVAEVWKDQSQISQRGF